MQKILKGYWDMYIIILPPNLKSLTSRTFYNLRMDKRSLSEGDQTISEVCVCSVCLRSWLGPSSSGIVWSELRQQNYLNKLNCTTAIRGGVLVGGQLINDSFRWQFWADVPSLRVTHFKDSFISYQTNFRDSTASKNLVHHLFTFIFIIKSCREQKTGEWIYSNQSNCQPTEPMNQTKDNQVTTVRSR